MDAAPDVLKKGGRLVVISFHSLEDRIVKDALRDGAKAGIFEVLTKKPLTATQEEIDRNPRSRSAKMRVAEAQIRVWLRSGRGRQAKQKSFRGGAAFLLYLGEF